MRHEVLALSPLASRTLTEIAKSEMRTVMACAKYQNKISKVAQPIKDRLNADIKSCATGQGAI